MKNNSNALVPAEFIERKIYFIHGHKVMLDSDLAKLYGVRPIALRQQVKRNKKRFPSDFVFQLTKSEALFLVSQNVIPSVKYFGGFMPYVFTEQGVAMLSSVLNSNRAIEVNIAIMRVFVRIRELMLSHKDIARRLDDLEKKYNNQFKTVFDAIRQLITEKEKPKTKIGFSTK